jgi:hypothetical protein
MLGVFADEMNLKLRTINLENEEHWNSLEQSSSSAGILKT